MFVALGNVGAPQDEVGAVFHAAVAGDGEFTGAVGAGNEFVSGAAAELAIFEGHRETEYEGAEETASERCGRFVNEDEVGDGEKITQRRRGLRDSRRRRNRLR